MDTPHELTEQATDQVEAGPNSLESQAEASSADNAEQAVELDEAEAAIPGTSPRLVVKRAGAETDIEFTFNCPAIIGRFDPSVGPIDIDLGSLDEGVYVSRKHARITQDEDGTYRIEDLGSSNGTYLLRDADFERVDSSELSDGTEIALGNARFVFHAT